MIASAFTLLRMAGRIIALALVMLAAFGTLVALLAVALAWLDNADAPDAAHLGVAIICGLVVGLFVAVFHVKRESIIVPIRSRQTFLAACRAVLHDLGYEVADKGRDQLLSRPSFRALLLGGRVHVQVIEGEGRITGPKVFVEILRSRLRLHSHCTSVEAPRRDNRVRPGDRLLKRVEMSLRVRPEQWVAVGEQVVRRLAGEGAEVMCEVHLMAVSPQGLREAVLEGPVREWLAQQRIHAEMHKDHVCWNEPSPRSASGEETVVMAQVRAAENDITASAAS
jgi:hypothetical protein